MPETTTVPSLQSLLVRITQDYPELKFIESAHFSWHAGTKHVSYKKSATSSTQSIFSLLHELGHALLSHQEYTHDIELLQMEGAAWKKAHQLAATYGITLDEMYVEDCLDTYRDWLHLRSTCPTCYGRSLQSSQSLYRCFNCQTQWSVTRSRLCRPYRLQKA